MNTSGAIGIAAVFGALIGYVLGGEVGGDLASARIHKYQEGRIFQIAESVTPTARRDIPTFGHPARGEQGEAIKTIIPVAQSASPRPVWGVMNRPVQ